MPKFVVYVAPGVVAPVGALAMTLMPMPLKRGSRMFARCGGLFIQASTIALAVDSAPDAEADVLAHAGVVAGARAASARPGSAGPWCAKKRPSIIARVCARRGRHEARVDRECLQALR